MVVAEMLSRERSIRRGPPASNFRPGFPERNLPIWFPAGMTSLARGLQTTGAFQNDLASSRVQITMSDQLDENNCICS